MGALDRRTFLSRTGAALAGVGWAAAARGADRKKPNIVFILADDLGRHQVGCYGNPFYETPHLDTLAAQGVKFTDAYAACPVCSPTRASIMTGKYPARLHITDYIPGNPFPNAKLKTPDWRKELPLGEVTLAEMLSEAGYACGHFGKWHLDDRNDAVYRPGDPGTPETQGFSDVLVTAKPDARETAAAGAAPDYDAHNARAITDRALAFMEAHRDRPFFCHMGHNLVHQPEMEGAARIVKYTRRRDMSNERGNNPVLAAMVETLDGQVGRVMKALDDLGLAQNTILVFFSDNGDYYGREGLKPFYGSKGDLYEGGVRMPLIVRWPGVVAPGTESAALMSSVDFFPTFAEIAGVPVRDETVDGVSVLSALRGETPPDRGPIFWHYPHYHSLGIGPSGAVREGKYKLIEWFEKSIDGPETPGALELYDLEADPGERNNLAASLPEKAAELHAKLAAWRKRVGAQEMSRNPEHDPERADRPH
ncbi:MAG: sulfatase [Candidatus Hydrogenedentes bacterium]|nr:sulfatase [Candidatus Hydrogenedentota bacterium]